MHTPPLVHTDTHNPPEPVRSAPHAPRTSLKSSFCSGCPSSFFFMRSSFQSWALPWHVLSKHGQPPTPQCASVALEVALHDTTMKCKEAILPRKYPCAELGAPNHFTRHYRLPPSPKESSSLKRLSERIGSLETVVPEIQRVHLARARWERSKPTFFFFQKWRT